MTEKAIEAAARALVRQYEIEDGFSEEQAEQHSNGEMWKNFRKAAECAIVAYEQAMWQKEEITDGALLHLIDGEVWYRPLPPPPGKEG